MAGIRAFNFSGFHVKLVGNVIKYHQSFVGRDYKAWAQMAPFIIFPYLDEQDKTLRLALSKVVLNLDTDTYILQMIYCTCRCLRLHTAIITIHLCKMSGAMCVKNLLILLVSANLTC